MPDGSLQGDHRVQHMNARRRHAAGRVLGAVAPPHVDRTAKADLRHASSKHLIAPGSPARTVVQALRNAAACRAADVAHVATRTLSDGDKKILSISAVQAPAWMRATLLSIADGARTGSGQAI